MRKFNLITIGGSGILLFLLISVIVWASLESNVFIGFQKILSTRWGIATIVDIYIALTFIGVWIGVMEGSVFKGIVWTLTLYAFGDITTLIYIMIRANKCHSFIKIFLPNEQNIMSQKV
tara:strand:- start:394 stop:750 length:357 start_codon:yes stop_codon:yes gene_type:complete